MSFWSRDYHRTAAQGGHCWPVQHGCCVQPTFKASALRDDHHDQRQIPAYDVVLPYRSRQVPTLPQAWWSSPGPRWFETAARTDRGHGVSTGDLGERSSCRGCAPCGDSGVLWLPAILRRGLALPYLQAVSCMCALKVRWFCHYSALFRAFHKFEFFTMIRPFLGLFTSLDVSLWFSPF